ncbi:protein MICRORCHIDIA 6-like [Rosa chinensis]|uniref:protein MICRORCHIDIA 6-like n=1 Tax=Rosa chinensis TaxID=74649 RepID=UPI001AD8CAC2|nr:protein MICRORCHIDIA 6-like [Rosa chinensis]
MVDYEFNHTTETLDIMHGREHFMSNLSLLLQWSPYSTEAELLKQFNDIGAHGTEVMIYNLWFNDDGSAELDFDTDPEVNNLCHSIFFFLNVVKVACTSLMRWLPVSWLLQDIRISGDTKKVNARLGWKRVNEQHIANRFHHFLRVYLSILYLQYILIDLKLEGQVITTIGFLNDAPYVSYHGFNVYHKNRLILPHWQVVSYLDSRGRGVVGVLEADFVEPSHNKQDFERTSLFQKLEVRLKEMTWEYCVIGTMKRKEHDDILPVENVKGAKLINTGKSQSVQLGNPTGNQLKDQEAKNLMQENNKLRSKC